MKKLSKYVALGGAALALLGFQQAAQAMNITVDEKLAPGDVDINQLFGTVNMELSGNQLIITLVNTSYDAAGDSTASYLLTGIGFTLPGRLSIASGSASMSGSSAINFTAPANNIVSPEWGYDGGGLNSGVLQSTMYPVNTAVSSMESQTTSQFASGSLGDPLNLDGPDFGLISALESSTPGNGVEAIRSTITITLNLEGTFNGNLLSSIENGWVALTFGSPTGGTPTVPDASTSFMLLGLAMMGIEGARRKFAKN